jgi:hypothetical protein
MLGWRGCVFPLCLLGKVVLQEAWAEVQTLLSGGTYSRAVAQKTILKHFHQV